MPGQDGEILPWIDLQTGDDFQLELSELFRDAGRHQIRDSSPDPICPAIL